MEFDIWEPPGAGRSQGNSHSPRVERVKFLGVEWELPGKEGRAEGRTGISKEKKTPWDEFPEGRRDESCGRCKHPNLGFQREFHILNPRKCTQILGEGSQILLFEPPHSSLGLGSGNAPGMSSLPPFFSCFGMSIPKIPGWPRKIGIFEVSEGAKNQLQIPKIERDGRKSNQIQAQL